MNEASPEPSGPPRALWQISTQWSQVNNPAHFVIRYAEALRRYLTGCLRDEHAAEDVLQQLLLQVTQRGFGNASPTVGRFRDYLLVVVRNAAHKHKRRAGRPTDPLTEVHADELADPRPDQRAALDEAWLHEWRSCLLKRALRALHAHEVETPGNLYHTVLQLKSEQPDTDQADLAAELSLRLGRSITHPAFRQTLKRARRHFALLLLHEVAGTLNAPSAADVEEELAALGLLSRIQQFLPEDWRTNPEVLRL